MNKKKIIIILCLCVCVLVFGYFGYKIYLINKYDVSEHNSYPNLSSEKVIINSNLYNKDIDYAIYNKANYVVDDGFVLSSDDSLTGYGRADVYVLDYKNSDDYGASLAVSSLPDLYNAFITDGALDTFGYSLDNININELYEKYDVKNTEDLYEAWFKDYKRDVNIFTSVSDIKYNYFITNTSLATKYKALAIEGDLSGYLYLVNDNIYQATIFVDNEPYEFVFINKNNNYFDISKVKYFLSNINISE